MGGNDVAGRGVTTDRAVVCTNGYSGNLVPTLRTTVIAPTSRGRSRYFSNGMYCWYSLGTCLR
jgi:hypothetical protein